MEFGFTNLEFSINQSIMRMPAISKRFYHCLCIIVEHRAVLILILITKTSVLPFQ